MAAYCVNKHGDHEVHKTRECTRIPEPVNRFDFDANSDLEAMAHARKQFADADGCTYCMPAYHGK
jgi:hypothetical protein